MRKRFVETTNSRKLKQVFSDLKYRGADETSLITVEGDVGTGKTFTLGSFAKEHKFVFLRMKRRQGAQWFMNELLELLRQQPPHGFERKFRLALATLREKQRDYALIGKNFTIVVDEADYIVRDSELVDTIRDLSDTTEVPIILVGMGKLRSGLIKSRQTTSRVFKPVNFLPNTLQDTENLFAGLCEVPVTDDLVGFVHEAARGKNREIKEAIGAIERFGKRNPPDEDGGLSLRDLAGEELMTDRETSGTIIVPESVL